MSRKTSKKTSAKADSKEKAPKATNRKTGRSQRSRLPFPPSIARRLGFECDDLTAADIVLHAERPLLRKTLAEYCLKYPPVKAGFERGQLLRNAAYCAETMNVTQAARWLGFETGFSFRRLMDSDAEVKNVWDQKKLETIVRGRTALLKLVDKGDARAIKMLESISHDEQQGQAQGADFNRLGMNQVSELFGYSRQAVTDWYNDKGLPRNSDNTFDLKTTIKWFEDYTQKKATRGKSTIGPLNPFQQVKTERERLKLLEDRGELVDRGAAIGFQIAQLQNVINTFDKITDLANLMYGQTREEIVKVLEDLRDECLARLQHMPDQLKLSEEQAVTLGVLYEQLRT